MHSVKSRENPRGILPVALHGNAVEGQMVSVDEELEAARGNGRGLNVISVVALIARLHSPEPAGAKRAPWLSTWPEPEATS